ncbi:MAG TPA: TolC family protein, partial [Rhodanobacteraceae bacterium]|nr:TolC family protein [Rhodanobacteraceae bacterium]
WHAASAAVGVAQAERLPHIQLTANAGSTALAIADVFTSGTGFWNLAAGITAPLFDGGALRHQAHAARAELAAAAAQYRGTVLQAFEDVADTLTAIDQDARALQSAVQADKASRITLASVRRRFRDGYASGLDLAQAEQGREQARMALIQARERRYTDTAALFQALGGGWQHRHSLAQP